MGSVLRLEKVSKSFGAVVVASDLDLEIAQGGALGMLGPNGAGKTTLFGIITGTIAPDGGRVHFEGRDVTRASAAERCRLGMARSFQVPQPFGGMTVFENLVVAAAFARGKTEREVYDLAAVTLEDCELADKANKRAGSLTLLDRKRLELARALATQPKLLLLDEVAGGLSEVECEDLVALIKKIRQTGVTIVWIEHVVHALLAVVDLVSPGRLGMIGLTTLAAGLALVATMPPEAGPFAIGWRMAVCGLGFGLFQTPNNKAMLLAAPKERSGGAGGMVGTARLLGQTTGAALVALCFGIAPQNGAIEALMVGAAIAVFGSIVSGIRLTQFGAR